MKSFIITIDTEGDNLWDWKPGDSITTNNTNYLERFQSISNNYGFKPVWLTNYEMINSDKYLDFICRAVEDNMAELGMHLHAWNSPPDYSLKIERTGAPFLIEYPKEIIEEKIAFLSQLIESRTGIKPVSHRAGRWATNETYFDLLIKYGYKVDCSVTPHIDHSSKCGQTLLSEGSDYRRFSENPFLIHSASSEQKILEVPMTIRKTHRLFTDKVDAKQLARKICKSIVGYPIWLRPTGKNLNLMKYLIDKIAASDTDYAMFMLHSSEMMPGGSPNFKNKEAIEQLYYDIEELFKYATECSFEGRTLQDYYGSYCAEMNSL